jgi:hypothetical protein
MGSQMLQKSHSKLQVEGPHVSVYLPMQPGFEMGDQNRITFKNTLKTVRRALSVSMSPMQIKRELKWLSKADQLARNTEFWTSQQYGIAIFMNPKELITYRLDESVEALIKIGKEYDTGPLDRVRKSGKKYYVLSLSQKHPRLFAGDRHGLRDVTPKSMKNSLSDSLRLDEFDREIQSHSFDKGGRSNTEGFHGHGSFKDKHKSLINEYFRNIDKNLHDHIKDTSAPLMLVGVEYLLPIYRQISKYPHLLEQEISGNFDHLKAVHLFERIKPMMFEKVDNHTAAA